MKTVLVWILIATPWHSDKSPPVQFGPFPDVKSCEFVAKSQVLNQYKTQCLRVQLAILPKE
jgi:hypothetical protein